MVGNLSVSKNVALFRSLSRSELPVSMLEDLIMAVTEDLVRSTSSYMMVPLTSENLPSISVTPTSATEKPTLECAESTENFSAAAVVLKNRKVKAATARNRRILRPWPIIPTIVVFIGIASLHRIHRKCFCWNANCGQTTSRSEPGNGLWDER